VERPRPRPARNSRTKIREYEDGKISAPGTVTVKDVITDWLAYGHASRSEATKAKCRYLCEGHIVPELGARKIRDPVARNIDKWLDLKAKTELANAA
jgi:hypothetical protein